MKDKLFLRVALFCAVAVAPACRRDALASACWATTEDCTDAAVSYGPAAKKEAADGMISCLCRDKDGVWKERWRKK